MIGVGREVGVGGYRVSGRQAGKQATTTIVVNLNSSKIIFR